MTRTRKVNGKYHYKGQVCKQLVGSRASVYHTTACKTSGGLMKKDLLMNKNGRIVSRRKHNTAKKEKRLEKHGFFAKKGEFGVVKGNPKRSSSKKLHKKRSTRRRRHTRG